MSSYVGKYIGIRGSLVRRCNGNIDLINVLREFESKQVQYIVPLAVICMTSSLECVASFLNNSNWPEFYIINIFSGGRG